MTADRTSWQTGASVPAGTVLRHLNAPADFHAMNEIANRIRMAIGQDFYTTDEQMALFYDHPQGFDPATDVVVIEQGGEVVGYARAGFRDQLDGSELCDVVPFLDPGRTGPDVFLAVIGAVEERLRALVVERPPAARSFLDVRRR